MGLRPTPRAEHSEVGREDVDEDSDERRRAGLFATPVAALEVPNAAERNAALIAIILKKREETPSVQASNAGGWHSDREILAWGGQPVVEILEFAKEMANRLTADRKASRAARHGT